MLYKKNYMSTLSDELFRSPTSEYRAAPFWAWNCKLEEKELLRQIDVFHRMGFGGFHMHVRTGMDTEYLSDEFMQLIRACTDKAKGEKMLAWLYDEDRWPSGAAGGIVTGETKGQLEALGISIPDVLKDNDSYNALKQIDGLIFTGPTGTNVNDVCCLLIK